MGVLIEGTWRDEELPQEVGRAGEFRRVDSRFRDRITADGSSGFKAETGRYHLYVAHGCPWAHRTMIYRAMKKLEDAIWSPTAIPGVRSRAGPSRAIRSFPTACRTPSTASVSCTKPIPRAIRPIPARLRYRRCGTRRRSDIVNNESSEIIRMLNSEFRGIAGDDTDFYPAPLRAEIDRINDVRLCECQQRRLSLRLCALAGSLRSCL